MIPDTGYFRWSHLRNWTSDPRCRVWGEVTLETVDERQMCRVRGWGHLGDCGHVAPGALFGRDITLETRHVTIGTGSEWGYPGNLDIKSQVQGLGWE